jgi:hypothetical protein
MKERRREKSLKLASWCLLAVLGLTSCNSDDDNDDDGGNNPSGSAVAVFAILDEDAIDNGNEPNNFSEVDVNDQLADIGLRQTLKYFQDNVGQTINLYSGQVGDEGFFVPRTIPNSWVQAGPTNNGSRNYFTPGPGLGAPNPDDDREVLLDEIPDVTPLRATGLKMLIGQRLYAVVYDGDVSINYSPLEGNLQGANLGVVALEVLGVVERTDGSTSSLPRVEVRILSVSDVAAMPLKLFENAPVPSSSGEPFDIAPPATVPAVQLEDAP